MKAKALWNHDAFFDYYDRWMDPRNAAKPKTYPRWGQTGDPFTDEMWAAYRKSVPDQPGGTRNLKWVWIRPTARS